MRLIKRYSNRKLYDTIGKSYVTLEHIEQFVKNGEEVKIIDNDTKEDLTAVAFSNIIYERAKEGQSLSPSFFKKVIRTGSSSMYDYICKTLHGLSSAAYFVEGEVQKKIKGLVSSGEITEEEGQKIVRDLAQKSLLIPQRLEGYIEELLQSAMRKLQIPSRRETERLNKALDQLEKEIQRLGRQVKMKSISKK